MEFSAYCKIYCLQYTIFLTTTGVLLDLLLHTVKSRVLLHFYAFEFTQHSMFHKIKWIMFLQDSLYKNILGGALQNLFRSKYLKTFEQIAFLCAWGNENPFASFNCHFCSYVKSVMNVQWSIKHIRDIKRLTYKVKFLFFKLTCDINFLPFWSVKLVQNSL